VAATALAGLTACAPKGADTAGNDPNLDPAAAQQEVPALADILGEGNSASPAASAAPAVAAPNTESLKAATIPKMGKVVLNQKGFVLYRFDKDTAKPPKSNCEGKCAQIWPPAITDGNPQLDGVDASLVGTVTRGDGSKQITIAGWPVYGYIGDLKAGQWKGQNVGGTWFVIAPDGKKNLTCLPTPAPAAVQPPAASESAAATGDGGSGGY
jgi:predicted lipoprotein with Yx(FWY)xxD motif